MRNKGSHKQGDGRTGAKGGRRQGEKSQPGGAGPGGGKPLDSSRKPAAPVQSGQQVEVEIIGISHEGAGVGRVFGFTLFVSGDVLPGEKALVEVQRVRSSFGHARLVHRLTESADRVMPLCAVFDTCGGCQLQSMSYDAQLRWKRQLVVDALSRIGKLVMADDRTIINVDQIPSEATIVHPVIGMDEPWRYRNKVHMPVGRGASGDREGGLAAGFYERGSHRIVEIDTCLIQGVSGDHAIGRVTAIARELGITPYDSLRGEGELRHIVVREGAVSGEVMVVLVSAVDPLPREAELVDRIAAEVPKLASLCVSINQAPGSLVFGEDEVRVLWGRDVIYDSIGDVRFAISARSFYQVNPVQTFALYGKALDFAGLTGSETVIDAYCGIGTISLFLAQRAARVYGVESVPEAVADARRNAALNGIDNAVFECGLAEHVLPRWRSEGIDADVIVVDPPRKGCDRALLDTILAMAPPRVVYVSCDPATLARDLRVLADGGYRVVEVQPVDMFPHTVHVECVILMEWRGEPN